MKRLFEVRVGGGRVEPGLLPVQALGLIQDLMAAMAEEGGDPEAWARANAHVEIVGPGSTQSAVLTEEYPELVGPAQLFALKAAERNLGPKGREFVDKYFKPGEVWDFAEVTVCNENRPSAYFDTDYRETVKEQRHPISGTDELYARVVRVGGERPTAKLEIGKQSGTFPVADQALAKKLGTFLFETVKIRADVSWDSNTLEILSLTVTGIDEDWQDIHLADVVAKHGRLPLELSVESTEELLAERRRVREER
jgi:hypothetical protein